MFGSTWGQNTQQQQQQQQPSGGLFGSSGGSGFGQPSTGFGQQNTGFGQQQQQPQQNTGGLFGQNTTNTSTGFGSSGFGQQNQQTNAFGARPAFGATGSSPFGQSNTTSTGGGLFGSGSNTTGGFGQTNTGTTGGLFGQKPATTGFGTSSTSGGLFGAKPAGTDVAPSNQVYAYTTAPPPPIPQTGTAAPPYQPTWQRDPPVMPGREAPPPHLFHIISAMEPYRGGSFEELRMLDYQQNRKEPTAQPAATGGFGQPAATGFGQTSTSTFGQPAQTNAFGAKPTGLFGASSGTSTFGSTTNAFGQNTGGTSSGGLFGQNNQTSTFGQGSTGTSGGLFGQTNTQQNTGGGLFGNAGTNAFGQNTQQQQQQQPQQQSGFGSFGAKPAFGSTTTTTGFGQQPATTNAFGQSSTGSTGFGFGQNQQQQQQQPQQQTGGLFGNTAQNTTTNAFGQPAAQNTGGSLFGNTSNTATQSGGLFGSAPKPGGLFGSTTPAAPATGTTTGFGGFGNTAAAPAAGGGLFGSTTPAAPAQTGGGLFGNTQTAAPATGGGLFGSTATNTQPAASGGLFGQAPKPGGLFGSTTAAPATGTTGFTGFSAQPAANTGGGLFGGNTAAAPATSSLFAPKPAAPSGGLFGSTAAAPATSSLFNQSQPASTGLFGSTAAAPSGGLFANSTLGQSNAMPQQQLTASVDQNPYGRNELFAYQGQKLETGTVNKKPALPPLTASSFRVTPSKTRVTQLRGFGSPLNSSQNLGRSSSPALSSSTRSLVGSPVPSDRYKGLTDAALSPNAFIPRPNVKKITVAVPKASVNGGDDPLESVLGKSALKSSLNGSAPPTPEIAAPARLEDTPTRRPQSVQPLDTLRTSNSVAVSERPLKRGDYWCRPKLDKLRQLSHEQLSSIENFTAGRKGYGEVTFLEPVDLTGLPSLSDFLGSVIIFESLELIVYPEETTTNKPPVGKGLNVPARISLENCFFRDKAGQAVTDPTDKRYQRQIKRMKSIANTEFISFSDDGVWTFKVEHFSRYGLTQESDDDDEDEDMDEGVASPPKYSDEDDEDFLPPTKSLHDDNMMDLEHDSGLDGTETSESMEDEEELEDSFTSESNDNEWDQTLKSRLGTQGMRNLRAMQASFFGNEKRAPQPSALDTKRALIARAVKRDQADFDLAEESEAELDDRAVKRASFGESTRPPKLRQPRKYSRVPLAESSIDSSVTVDAGLCLGRSFRASWGPNGELVHMGKICGPNAKFTPSPDAVVYVEQVALLADSKPVERQRADRLLELLLEHTAVENQDDEPAAFTDTSIRFRQFASLFDAGDRSHEANVWRLGQALFDEIDLGLPNGTSDEVHQRVLEVRRKLALSKWLEDAVAPAVDLDLAKAGDNRPAKVFALLTGNQTDRAVQSALDGNDMRLATLVSQAGGSDVFRAEMQRQLDDWTKYKTDPLIGYEYRKLYALLAGITDVSQPDVLVADDLDWKRAFGLHLWHGCAFDQNIADVQASYAAALEANPAPASPLPPYIENKGAPKWNLPESTDILYNLIRMYSDLGVPLDDVLSARGASPSPTDFRLPWHLYLLLRQALQKRDFADREEEDEEGFAYSATANQVTGAYAAQLEEEGQWTWAAFVLLHLEKAESRREAIRALLFRHPDPTPTEQDFLTAKLRIPWAWLHEARAASLAASGDAYREYYELIPAGLADRAQRTLVTKLAPEAVLREDYALLRRLCEALEPLQPTAWEYNGGLFLDYLDIVTRVRPLLTAVLKAGKSADPAEASTLAGLAKNLPRVLQLLPALFRDRDDVQQVASLSDMLSELQMIATHLHAAGYIPRPPVSDLLVDKDRLHLLQGAATESFERSLAAITA